MSAYSQKRTCRLARGRGPQSASARPTWSVVAFRAYAEQALVPTLRTGDTVTMDNLRAHNAAGIRQAIEATLNGQSILQPS